MIHYELGSHITSPIIGQIEIRQSSQELAKGDGSNPKGDAVKPSRFSQTLWRALKQRELGTPAITGDHKRAALVSGPGFVLSHDVQSQDTSVPISCLLTVRDEQLDVINLVDSESVARR